MFWFVEHPTGYYAYAVSVLLVLATGMENVTVDCLLLRTADREIRGVVFGIANACGYIGMLCFSLGGGILFDTVGPYSPFMLVGSLDLIFGTFCTVFALCGWISNDMLEKEVQRRL